MLPSWVDSSGTAPCVLVVDTLPQGEGSPTPTVTVTAEPSPSPEPSPGEAATVEQLEGIRALLLFGFGLLIFCTGMLAMRLRGGRG